ncbi:DUF6356 family protein [Hyphococcus flavus]|uniref:DUF6356 family protein n=1 Tax=Hyphococcus flavus TaxID=1866326 RepID=A0AAF0CCA8_9PROT|nr:DUF6356 family protein [Hyphococcus flavus]WDI33025.1 DUF6356 family protein [Hyphococcus flavus]
MIKRAFTEHPASVGESYTQHMGMAFGFGAKMVTAGFACLLHGIFPFLFKCTGRNCIEELHNRMVTHRDKRNCAETMPAVEGVQKHLQAAE